MKLKASLLSFIIAVCGTLTAQQPASSSQPASKHPGHNLQQLSTLEQRIQRIENGLLPAVVINGQAPVPMKLSDRMRHYKVPGVSIAVINHGEIEWARGYGVKEAGTADRVTNSTLFQAASISKPVTAMAALRLVQEGKLKLDEDVNQELKSWKVPENEFTKEKQVTLRELLSHSAGLTVHGFTGYAAGEPVPTLVQILNGEKPANSEPIRVDIPPGSKWRYSGGGYVVTQQLILDVTGKSFPDFMEQRVLRPLQMTDSTYQQPLPQALRAQAAAGHRGDGKVIPGKWHTYPEMSAAGLWTTPSDLAKFAIAIQNGKSGKSQTVLSQAMITQMLTKQIDDWGLGLNLQGTGRDARFSHGGANEGFRCSLIAYDDTGQGAAVMTNSDSGGSLAEEVLLAIAHEYGWSGYKPKEITTVHVDPHVLADYAGTYKLPPDQTLTIAQEGDKLLLEADGQKFEMVPESETKFFVLGPDFALQFVKDEKGKVASLDIEGGPRAKKVKSATQR